MMNNNYIKKTKQKSYFLANLPFRPFLQKQTKSGQIFPKKSV